MMEWTDRHCRYFLRLLSSRAVLYTEMIVAEAVLHGDRARLLEFHPAEHPVALQLGGSDPQVLARAARIGAEFGFDEINLNVGCPSDRVQAGSFGACLMRDPERVARGVTAMREAVAIPVTVKSRIGVDEREDYKFLESFVSTVAAAGADAFIVHARRAVLSGLSPKENRTIPPLHYDRVWRLKADFPELPIVINGGIVSVAQAQEHWAKVDGVMLGRAAYHDPYLLSALEQAAGTGEARSRQWVVEQLAAYCERELARGTRLSAITRHALGLYSGQPGARAWRRALSEGAARGAGPELLLDTQRALGRAETPEAAATGTDGR
jgi:tRNA-dihydrouridine synthase A